MKVDKMDQLSGQMASKSSTCSEPLLTALQSVVRSCFSTLGRFGRAASVTELKTAVKHVQHHVALSVLSASASDGH